MSIYLQTGLPGAGKTLRTLWEVEERRKKEGRAVYVNGIPELMLPWEKLEDPKKWYDLPDGSIVVIDEAQRVFGVRRNGAEVPRHIAEFETHRHRGFDFYIITQSPMFLDSHVRKLADRHVHLSRPFGHSYAVIFEWQFVVNDPTKEGMWKHAIKTRWKYPKEVFGWYKSASEHTMKKRLPGKVIVFPVLVVGIAALVWFAKHRLSGNAVPSGGTTMEVPAGTPAPGAPKAAPKVLEPFAGYELYFTGTIERGNERRYEFAVEKEGESFTVTALEMAAAGYMVQPLGPCIARVGWGESVRYVLCRGRGDAPEPTQVAEGGGGGVMLDAPSAIRAPKGLMASSKGP